MNSFQKILQQKGKESDKSTKIEIIKLIFSSKGDFVDCKNHSSLIMIILINIENPLFFVC
jgi:hypothetical protein